MKPILTLFMLVCMQAFAQKEDPLSRPFKIEKDTTYAMVDKEGKTKNLPGMPYIRKSWPENGKYRELLFDAAAGHLLRAAWYKDKDFTEKDGNWEEFHANGMTKDSGRYENNLKQGTFKGWYENGNEHHVFHYNKGLPIDTGFIFRDNGTLSLLSIADNNGNGIEQDYYENGKIRMLGRIKEGKRNGLWTVKREDGSRIMEISYMMDSVTAASCFEKDGATLSKDECIYERPAKFPDGAKGWQEFLRKNMTYPNSAINRSIQGVVRIQFIVNKDGTIGEFKILSSPDESLSEEVLRFMKKSPKWIPAMQFNQPVIYRQVQAVTFRLN